MSLEPEERLAEELRVLRADRAARDPMLPERLRPLVLLRQVCGITDSYTQSRVLRSRLGVTVERVMGGEPELLVALQAGLGLHPGADQRSLRERMLWLARYAHYSERTAWRRFDKASTLFCHLASASVRGVAGATADMGYEVSELNATLRLDLALPMVHDRRKIHPTRDPLEEIVGKFSVPPTGSDPRLEVRYGGTLRRWRREQGGLVVYEILPPTPLRWSDTHEYGIDCIFPPEQLLAPHFVVQAVASYKVVNLRVRFGGRIPVEVWRVDGAFPRQVDGRPSNREALRLDDSGEVAAAFDEVHEGLAYGLAWVWEED